MRGNALAQDLRNCTAQQWHRNGLLIHWPCLLGNELSTRLVFDKAWSCNSIEVDSQRNVNAFLEMHCQCVQGCEICLFQNARPMRWQCISGKAMPMHWQCISTHSNALESACPKQCISCALWMHYQAPSVASWLANDGSDLSENGKSVHVPWNEPLTYWNAFKCKSKRKKKKRREPIRKALRYIFENAFPGISVNAFAQAF